MTRLWNFLRTRPYGLYLANCIKRIYRCVDDTHPGVVVVFIIGLIIGILSMLYATDVQGKYASLTFFEGVAMCVWRGLYIGLSLSVFIYVFWEVSNALSCVRHWANNYHSNRAEKNWRKEKALR
jgi:uncharacterized protein HemY